MSGDFPFVAKIVSPVKCNEKPWNHWVSEIGHVSPRRDDEVFTSPAPVEKGGASARRSHDSHPYKVSDRARYRRAGLNRLKYESMSLHGLFPQMDNLNAAVCHMCGDIVKCSAAYRHLLDSHSGMDPLLPPPPPATTVRNRSRHKKEAPPPLPVDLMPVKMETSPVHNATAPLSRIVLPQPELQYLDEASTSSAVTGEVQVCVESGELPVVSIQDTEDLPLGENITDDIFAIMNSEGIQSADDITNAADWKNIIRDIGNMQEINFPQTTEPVQSQDLYGQIHAPNLSAYTLSDTDLSNIQFAPNTSPMLPSVIDANVHSTQALKPRASTPSTPSTKSQSRSKTSKTKFNLREYDPNKHCGVVTVENPKPCTRSLTCKAHALSLRRTVDGRSKPFDTLLAEHRASRDAGATAAAAATTAAAAPLVLHTPAPAPVPAAPPASVPLNLPPLLVNTIDLSTFNGLTAEQQVHVENIYESLLNVDDPNSVLPDTSSITSLLSQPLTTDPFIMPDDAEIPTTVPILSITPPVEPAPSARIDEKPDEGPPPLVPSDVCWYSSCPRPLALCTFNASHAGGAITLGKKFATVRSNIKSSLSRSQCKSTGGTNNYYYNQNALSLSKSVHMNASKTNKPEVRKLIVTCSATSSGNKEVQQTLSELFGGSEVRHTMNGHVGHMGLAGAAGHKPRSSGGSLKHSKRPSPAVLDLGFSLDVLADEKC
ncbi:ataxin-7-like protein 1 [Galleria mellonella]|uniref:Ataxin-7-like protein 1 n=1 Tax=Galleria mellonella TaxID=7137 RepID=A0A6J1WRL8_GALME|nr:ataxin-7-like protein 1 [Galleria mellonella]